MDFHQLGHQIQPLTQADYNHSRGRGNHHNHVEEKNETEDIPIPTSHGHSRSVVNEDMKEQKGNIIPSATQVQGQQDAQDSLLQSLDLTYNPDRNKTVDIEMIKVDADTDVDVASALPKPWSWNDDAAYAPIAPAGVSISSLVRTIDPALEVVFRCWMCDSRDNVEFDNKLALIHHLKATHTEVPGIESIEKRMRVSICMVCGLNGSCEHRARPEDTEEDGQDEDDLMEDSEGNSPSKSPRGSKRDEYPCTLCPRVFPTSGSRGLHYNRDHPNEKAYQCIYCPEAFHTHHKLVVHTRTHTGYKPYVCGICGSKFPKNSDLNRHARTHTGEKPFQCAQCGKQFTQRSSLQKHAKRHADKSGGFPCYHCGLTFQEESALDEHTKAEHGERTWKCKVCGKLFEERRHLFVHEKIHKEQETFACSFCGRLFTKRHQLIRHEERIHRCKDELKCKVCNKEFRRRENLNRHMNIHLDKREFQCTECGMAFTEKGSLKRHVLSRHEQYRPFQCRICGKTFSRRFLVRKHHERVHKAYPFECAEVVKPNHGSDRPGYIRGSMDDENGGGGVGDLDGGGGSSGMNDGVGEVVAAIINEREQIVNYSLNDVDKYKERLVDNYAEDLRMDAGGVSVSGNGDLRGRYDDDCEEYGDGRDIGRQHSMGWNNMRGGGGHVGHYGGQ